MTVAHVSRRQFMITGGALLAATYATDWTEAFQPVALDDAARAETADAALARAAALGASYADIRINRYRRESIATRERQVQNVSRSASYGMGLRVLVNGAWGFAAANRVEPGAARTLKLNVFPVSDIKYLSGVGNDRASRPTPLKPSMSAGVHAETVFCCVVANTLPQ